MHHIKLQLAAAFLLFVPGSLWAQWGGHALPTRTGYPSDERQMDPPGIVQVLPFSPLEVARLRRFAIVRDSERDAYKRVYSAPDDARDRNLNQMQSLYTTDWYLAARRRVYDPTLHIDYSQRELRPVEPRSMRDLYPR
jgi:hypothetical protein